MPLGKVSEPGFPVWPSRPWVECGSLVVGDDEILQGRGVGVDGLLE